MIEILIGALSTAFFLVRIVKGPWTRHPQFVAAATIGAVVASLILYKIAPDLEYNIIVGGFAGLAGAGIGMFAFDRLGAS
jgi:hypothetical protein